MEVILSCRLLLNLRSAGGGSSTSKPQIHPWSDNSKIHANPSTSVLRDQSRTEVSSMHGTEKKLEPNRKNMSNDIKEEDPIRNAQATWDARSLYASN